MNSEEFKTVIGLEIHTQLKTKSKMFCSCSNDAEGKEPNTVVCPVCLGMPGTLPVANIEALRLVTKIGLALNSKIADLSWFDRKHYFYPDLPKAYQISQYQNPFCEGGELEVGGKLVRLNRVHLEEDAGKLVHAVGSSVSYVDLNRAGTPLAELVTEPDLESPAQAKEFLQELRDLLRAIGVSDADMEKGHLRCDANISVTKGDKMSPITEIKNLNSFKFVEKALVYEEKRLREDFVNWPEGKTKTTRGFDAKLGNTYTLREKEEAKDYRYFPEPDIPPIELAKLLDIEQLKAEITSLPMQVRAELVEIGLDEQTAKLVSSDKSLLEKLAEIKAKMSLSPKLVKTLINDKKARELKVDQLADLSKLLESDKPSNLIRQIIDQSIARGVMPSEVTIQEADSSSIIDQVLEENADAVEKYKSGKKEVIGFLIGQVMKAGQGRINPNTVREEIIKIIEN